MPIISGTAEFTTPRPFEAKSSRVALNFTVPEGVSEEDYMAQVGRMARQQALAMVADGVPAGDAHGAGHLLRLAAAAAPGLDVPPTPAPRKRAAVVPPPAPAHAAPPVSADLEETDSLNTHTPPALALVPPMPAATLPPATPGSTAVPPAPPADPLALPIAAGLPVHLTDAAINNAVVAKLSTLAAGTPERQALVDKVKQLRAEYTGGLEIAWPAVQDAEKRSAFLARLSNLT